MNSKRAGNNPFFNFLKIFRKHRHGWSNVKLAVEASRRWQEMPQAERRQFVTLCKQCGIAGRVGGNRRADAQLHKMSWWPFGTDPEIPKKPTKQRRGKKKQKKSNGISKRAATASRKKAMAKKGQKSVTAIVEPVGSKKKTNNRKRKPPKGKRRAKKQRRLYKRTIASDSVDESESLDSSNECNNSDNDEFDEDGNDSDEDDDMAVDMVEWRPGGKRTWQMMMADFVSKSKPAAKRKARLPAAKTVIPGCGTKRRKISPKRAATRSVVACRRSEDCESLANDESCVPSMPSTGTSATTICPVHLSSNESSKSYEHSSGCGGDANKHNATVDANCSKTAKNN